ncbi:MAG: hypothetical protein NZ988_00750 [Thaumarchaeota archaeon]|nr:hypothetical protein [Candidatus Calditenuaceae archaeon]MDW8186563.1 hypothetical protein [Nitrososphaerota archaeon]
MVLKELATAYLILTTLSFYPSELAYPPLRTTPSWIASFDKSSVIIALPAERSIALYDLSSGNLWRVELGFAPEGLAVSGRSALVYSRLDEVFAVVDVDRLIPVSEVRMRIEGVWPINDGFIVHKGTGLSLVDLKGEELRYLKVDAVSDPWYVSAHGRTVWFVGGDLRTVYVLDVERWEARKVATHSKMVSAIAAFSEDTVAVASEGWIGTYRTNGESRAFELPYQVSSRTKLFPAKAGRVIFIDEAYRSIGLLGIDLKWHSLLEITPSLTTSPSPSKVYVFDLAQRKLNYYDVTFKPEIRDVKLDVRGGQWLQVEATLRDLDGDLISYSPSVLLKAADGSVTMAAMRSIGGDRFAANVDLREFSGEVEITITAADTEGNQAESQPYKVKVDRGGVEVVTFTTAATGTAQTTPQAGASSQLTDLLIFSVELAFFAVIVMSIVLIALRTRKRSRKRIRRG